MQEENGIKCISDFCTSTDDTEIVCRFSSVVSYFLKAKFSLQLKNSRFIRITAIMLPAVLSE